MICGLIDAIGLTPSESKNFRLEPETTGSQSRAGRRSHPGEPTIELKGNPAAMLSAAKETTRSPETGDLELQIAMVRGRATD